MINHQSSCYGKHWSFPFSTSSAQDSYSFGKKVIVFSKGVAGGQSLVCVMQAIQSNHRKMFCELKRNKQLGIPQFIFKQEASFLKIEKGIIKILSN